MEETDSLRLSSLSSDLLVECVGLYLNAPPPRLLMGNNAMIPGSSDEFKNVIRLIDVLLHCIKWDLKSIRCVDSESNRHYFTDRNAAKEIFLKWMPDLELLKNVLGEFTDLRNGSYSKEFTTLTTFLDELCKYIRGIRETNKAVEEKEIRTDQVSGHDHVIFLTETSDTESACMM